MKCPICSERRVTHIVSYSVSLSPHEFYKSLSCLQCAKTIAVDTLQNPQLINFQLKPAVAGIRQEPHAVFNPSTVNECIAFDKAEFPNSIASTPEGLTLEFLSWRSNNPTIELSEAKIKWWFCCAMLAGSFVQKEHSLKEKLSHSQAMSRAAELLEQKWSDEFKAMQETISTQKETIRLGASLLPLPTIYKAAEAAVKTIETASRWQRFKKWIFRK